MITTKVGVFTTLPTMSKIFLIISLGPNSTSTVVVAIVVVLKVAKVDKYIREAKVHQFLLHFLGKTWNILLILLLVHHMFHLLP